MGGILRVAGLAWAEAVMKGVFFIMQTYFTNVWKMSFTNAATIMNVWGGLYRILPFFFLFIAETCLGNFVTLAFSSISSSTGMVLITVATTPVFGQTVSSDRCFDKEGCVGHTEKILFITGMVLIGLGRAARVATAEPFIDDQIETSGHEEDETDHRPRLNWWRITCVLVFFGTPMVVIFAFPYIKKWYVLFGLSASCTTLATLYFLLGSNTYKKPPPKAERSPVTDFARVFVAAAFKITQPLPAQDDARLHRIDGEEFQSLSPTRVMGFLHKAAIVMPGDRVGSWTLCSVSEVESAKATIRLVPILSCFIMFGVVSSIGNTYFIEQASHMNFNIGKWKPPYQLMHLISAYAKFGMVLLMKKYTDAYGEDGAIQMNLGFPAYSVICCAVAAAVERRRIHVLTRHDLLGLPDDGKVPMSAAWLFFQITFAGFMEPFSEFGFSAFFEIWAPKSMKRYKDCYVEGVTGFGFLCTALSVYVVGQASEAGGGKSWFQPRLNQSRLDRYYWVLTALCSLNLIAYAFVFPRPDGELLNMDGFFGIKSFERAENDIELWSLKKGGPVELVLRHHKLSPPITLNVKNKLQFLEYVLS
ncbi:protein NRT1/ PTR FAMILY 5.5-like [Salvia hispanica]|uniref:protein NRT1/ PTR FAMILY 5.5-like n=1 Tax=Salvia hispanica TaxID=49212 RepID=UPI002009073E|nr:protein NRT1/ PTR FAMILY 5.5-like [Salvia hispanica]